MRERILSEIKQFVAENDGKVPGIKAFEIYAGIPRKEWLGKLWARWGDALVEAGYEPNSLTGRIDSDVVLKKVAEASVHFKRLPSASDLRLYGRSNPDFPATTTLENHFLNRAGLISALRAWLIDRPEFAEVAAMLPSPPPSTLTNRSQLRDGSVYLIRSGDFFKVGRSDELERRVKEIKVALPQAASLEHTIMTDDPPGIEAYWHRRFADKRANGERFRLSRADVLAFKRRRFQ